MLQNSTAGKRFFGKHFWPGVAEYREGDKVTRVLLKEDTIRKMNPTFEGKPVFVEHVDEVIEKPIDELKQEADGWVIKSFYNEVDGDTWAEFLVTSQKGLDAIANGWKLSNAYVKGTTDQTHGLWNGVDYDEEITSGNFEHLAIVSNPRYAESIILTPEEFKTYNEEKKAELVRLQNSLNKQESSMAFNFFKKSKVENGLDFEGLSVVLPKTQREVALVDLINEADVELKEIKDQVILVNEEKDERMTIDEAVKEIHDLRNKCNELEEKLKAQEEDKKENEEEKKEELKEEFKEEKKENEEKKEEFKEEFKEEKKDNEEKKEEFKEEFKEEKKENEDDKKEDDKKDNECKKNFLNEVLNAQQICENSMAAQDILLPSDRAELAKKYF